MIMLQDVRTRGPSRFFFADLPNETNAGHIAILAAVKVRGGHVDLAERCTTKFKGI